MHSLNYYYYRYLFFFFFFFFFFLLHYNVAYVDIDDTIRPRYAARIKVT